MNVKRGKPSSTHLQEIVLPMSDYDAMQATIDRLTRENETLRGALESIGHDDPYEYAARHHFQVSEAMAEETLVNMIADYALAAADKIAQEGQDDE